MKNYGYIWIHQNVLLIQDTLCTYYSVLGVQVLFDVPICSEQDKDPEVVIMEMVLRGHS